MNIKEAAPKIDFADSSYRSCEMSNNTLFVFLNSWDDKIIKITFNNSIEFIYKIGSFVAGFYELEDWPLLNEILSKYYKNLPEKHPFKVFVIKDIEDCDFITVVAEHANVIKS